MSKASIWLSEEKKCHHSILTRFIYASIVLRFRNVLFFPAHYPDPEGGKRPYGQPLGNQEISRILNYLATSTH